ncbi:hypothetical protein Bhyg_05053, partial [Pseudolycoriella hygida]
NADSSNLFLFTMVSAKKVCTAAFVAFSTVAVGVYVTTVCIVRRRFQANIDDINYQLEEETLNIESRINNADSSNLFLFTMVFFSTKGVCAAAFVAFSTVVVSYFVFPASKEKKRLETNIDHLNVQLKDEQIRN